MDKDELERQLSHLGKVSPAASAVLLDPFSDLTRQRQIWLLGIALTCVLLSFRIVTISEISYGAFKFSPGAQLIVLQSLKIICAYLAIAFAASAHRDLAVSKFKNMANRVEIARWALDGPIQGKTLLEHRDAIRARLDEIPGLLEVAAGHKSNSEQFMDLYNELSTKKFQLRAVEEEIESIVAGAWGVSKVSRSAHLFALGLEVLFPLAFASYAIFWL